MKSTILILSMVLLVFAACTTQAETTNANGNVAKVSGKVVEIDLEAWQWDFSPKQIRVKEGDTVRINAKSRDVPHGMAIPEFGFNLGIYPGETNTGEFVASKKGTYKFSCSLYCGDGHMGQGGTLIVE